MLLARPLFQGFITFDDISYREADTYLGAGRGFNSTQLLSQRC